MVPQTIDLPGKFLLLTESLLTPSGFLELTHRKEPFSSHGCAGISCHGICCRSVVDWWACNLKVPEGLDLLAEDAADTDDPDSLNASKTCLNRHACPVTV